MPGLPYPVTRIHCIGTIAAVQDWSFGAAVDYEGEAPSGAELQAWLEDLESDAGVMWDTATVGLKIVAAVDTLFTGLRAYSYLANQQTATAQAELIFSSAKVGTGSSIVSARNSLVASTLTGLPGRSNRGRMYVPATGAPCTTGHVFTTPSCTAVSTSIAGWLSALNASQIGSRALRAIVPANRDFAAAITQVAADNVPDTQRRRSDKIAPTARIVTGVTPA